MQTPWTPDIPPAMITDDIAFVGGKPVSVHCLTTNRGLILLDTGYPNMMAGIEANLAALGFSLKDVRYVLHSHGHRDHYGCTAEIVRRTGAQTLIGVEDAPVVTGEAARAAAQDPSLVQADSFRPDVCFRDGDVLQLDDRAIRCVHAPGHTAGTYAFFLRTKVGGIEKIAAMHGGVGLNTLSRQYLESHALPLSVRDQYRASLHRLMPEMVDVVLGNHPGQNQTAEKIALLAQGGTPFVDPTGWTRLLTEKEQQLDQLIAQEG